MQKKYTILRFLMLALTLSCSAKTNLSKKQKWGIGGGVTTLTTGGIGAAVYSSRNKMKKIDYSDSDSEENILLFKPSENMIEVIARKKGFFGKVSDHHPFRTKDIDYLKAKRPDAYEDNDGVLRFTKPMSDEDYRGITNALNKRRLAREPSFKPHFTMYTDKDGKIRFLSKEDYIKTNFAFYRDNEGNLHVVSKTNDVEMRKLRKKQEEDRALQKSGVSTPQPASTVETQEVPGGKGVSSVGDQVDSDTSAINEGVNNSQSTVQSGSNQPPKQTGSDGQSQVEPGTSTDKDTDDSSAGSDVEDSLM